MSALMDREKTWAEVVATAKERVKIGQTDVYLGHDNPNDLDWSKCVSMETGGSHRLDMDTTVAFHFNVAGLTLRWYFDVEKREANGRGVYMIDTEGVTTILVRLPPKPLMQFKAYLARSANAIEKNGLEQLQWVKSQLGEAAILRGLSHQPALSEKAPKK